ncbi:glycoside hydrolase family 3 C-terminal domain-containing protein [Vallitalea pronyensis]|uniref:Glycoside hydrolase family 3 C-terminal domain-containing protein n=1 Tax=Vallitalea pronyensis TaxID=1348613 RepID=A0A8J8MKQ0_9FIRM|nr:glycoside hydrolase family 3 C-terminal domain-containing protein [Vallitalea pronyensis]QUI23525.1 glycoside hydrolase family 3 C-terminal domain-containing protein [Vallitalea pronyensis]
MEKGSVSSNIEKLIQAMTLEEKASLCSGKNYWETQNIDRLGIPSIMMSDGSHGLRKQKNLLDPLGFTESVKSTCYPTASTVACSFDKELLYLMGDYIGRECQTEHVSVLLGPGVNIKRSPLCGRNYEYYSEDPYLTGELASAFVQGLQSHHVGACLNHFVANNQEKNRMTLDTILDERTLREIYLSAFEHIVKTAKPWSILGAFNRVNGEFMCENQYLLKDILRNEWGFEGIVISDWGAINDRVKGLMAGADIEMPSSCGKNNKKIVMAVKKKNLKEDVLDKTVKRILKGYDALSIHQETAYDRQEHHHIARHIACESLVLLKNKDHILPLSKTCQVAIIGEYALKPMYQGLGSSRINPTRIDNAYEQIVKITGTTTVTYAKGYHTHDHLLDPQLIHEATDLARKSDIALLFIGTPESCQSEGIDRKDMALPEPHRQLILEISQVNTNIVVILMNGGPVEMPWVDRVKAILACYLPGQGGGYAIANILYGDINPSGKLTETFPLRLKDNPTYRNFPKYKQQVQYREGIYVGYRYYDTASIDVLYPFGHGLSYTTFVYTDLRLSQQKIKDTEGLTVTFKVTNTGLVEGKEVVQLYIKDRVSSIFRPEKELKGFHKMSLLPNQTKEVVMTLHKRDFAYYNVEMKDWCVESGIFDILVGASSRDLRLQASLEIQSTSQYNEEKNQIKELLPSYYAQDDSMNRVSAAEFKLLYGHPIKDTIETPFTMNSRLIDIKNNLGKYMVSFIVKMYENHIEHTIKDEMTSEMMQNMLWETPIRCLVNLSQGLFTDEIGEFIVAIANKKKRLIKGIKFFRSLLMIKKIHGRS